MHDTAIQILREAIKAMGQVSVSSADEYCTGLEAIYKKMKELAGIEK
jgi:hypothetical protein